MVAKPAVEEVVEAWRTNNYRMGVDDCPTSGAEAVKDMSNHILNKLLFLGNSRMNLRLFPT